MSAGGSWSGWVHDEGGPGPCQFVSVKYQH